MKNKDSLQDLNNWLFDVLDTDFEPKDIYNEVLKVLTEKYYYHKYHCSRAYEMLALFQGNGKIDVEESEEVSLAETKSESSNTWTLPVELDGLTGDCLVTLPDDLLDKVGWKENDQLEWIDCGDGTFKLSKV
jgi:hypothetical protein